MDASKAKTPEGKAKECASANKLDFDKIQSCFSGAQGKTLLKAASEYFDGKFPKPVGVPHIEINGKALGDGSRSYAAVLKDLCATGIKAGACSKSDEIVIV
eukprot:gnl/MRDRNA2_/MRDRNA2_27473_c0_seq1.p1 gnl/MRDRNA2_/MRDRNA2_27473_c0~~gnl/MRDRNA2_/MRDRNA2_27473_c0_seq1.p1  ORF type:complete len:101 (-),score=26.73 gnl/MRDRNA2_/MRDRNA2_27473_c0_seq1:341-643(-)